jgi:hypothetical protein
MAIPFHRVLVLAFLVFPHFCISSFASDEWHRVAVVAIEGAAPDGFVQSGAIYKYNSSEIPPELLPLDDSRRTVIFANRLEFSFMGLNPAAQYEVRAAFLSDSADRKMEIRAGNEVLDAGFALPLRQLQTKTWPLPAPTHADGLLKLAFHSLSGANAVVSSLEIWSTDSTPLKAPPSLAERLAAMAVPLPCLRPVPSDADHRIRLDGEWRFCPSLPDDPAGVTEAMAADWKPIQVPGEWVMQGFHVASNQCAGYFREFTVPAGWTNERVILRFDTVHSVASVWVNGVKVGSHEGAFLPFEFDVTDALREGGNRLVVGVKSYSFPDILASATQYAGHSLGGITRKVTLYSVPRVHVSSLAFKTLLGTNYLHAALTIAVTLTNASDTPMEGVSLALALHPPGDGATRDIQSPGMTFWRVAPHEEVAREFTISVSNVVKWDTEHPQLYSARVTLEGLGNRESLVRRIGFRQVEVRGNQVFVNNHPIKLRGVCRHETHPLQGRGLNAEWGRRDAEIFRAANVNYIRTSHYPPLEEFLDACDELGVFVECEAPLCWVNHSANANWQTLDSRDSGLFPLLMRANLSNVQFNRNHPSILLWSLANESAWTPLFAEVNRRVKQLDPTRPTSFHDQCWDNYNNAGSHADIAVYHYPDTNGPARCDRENRPTLFGEYCHVQTYNQREHFTDPSVRDQWGPRFAEMYDLMYRHPGCLGGAIWSGIDDAFYLPDGQAEGYGFWGVIDGWRRAKPETFHVRKTYSPIRVTTKTLTPGSGPIHLELENRFDFTDLREVGIHWIKNGEEGAASGTMPPHGTGVLTLTPQTPLVSGETLRVRFNDPRGFVCEEVELPVGTPQAVLSDAPALALGEFRITTNASSIQITSQRFQCDIATNTGRIANLKIDGKPRLIGGPVLQCLPLETGPCEPKDLTQFGVFNDVCSNWTAHAVAAQSNPDGSVQISVAGTCDAASGNYTLRFAPDGTVEIEYDLKVSKDVNPRQVGMVFYVSRECDTLRWERQAEWSAYPQDHIGRPHGEAKAAPAPISHYSPVRTVPTNSWSTDANILGSADFRSTKSHFLTVSLTSASGQGLTAVSDGAQSARAFVDGDRIGLLIAGINAGGAESFFGMHHAPDRHPLKAGTPIRDTIRLRLLAP